MNQITNKKVLEVKNLTTSICLKDQKHPQYSIHNSNFNSIPIIEDISFSIEKNKTLALVGESGCGKSITAKSIMKLISDPLKITKGEIILNGNNITNLSDKEMRPLRGKKISLIFQNALNAFNPVYSIGYQIKEQILTHNNISNQKAKKAVIDLLKKVKINDPEKRYNAYPHELSGGMRQRAMIAMAISCNPDLLIADEPTTALDVSIQIQILKLLKELQKMSSMAIQFITHDLSIVKQISDQVIVMYLGKICEIGSTKKILNNPRHPYTQMLLKSIPVLGVKKNRLAVIPGKIPNIQNRPSGCPFKDRCSYYITKKCDQEIPKIELSFDHIVYCTRYSNN